MPFKDGFGHLHSVDFARQEFDALSAFSLRHVVWQRVIRGAGRFKVRGLIGHGFCCILFELALSLSNKNETAVRGCSPVLSVSVGLLSRKVNSFT